MKLKVIGYEPHPFDYHVCRDERGGEVKADLLVSGDLAEDTDPRSLIGKTVEVEWTSPYVSIAHGVQLIQEQQ